MSRAQGSGPGTGENNLTVVTISSRSRRRLSLRYDEVFGPADPPTTSTWEIVAPAARVLGRQEVDGVPTRQVSFFVQVGRLPIWYRLWIDDDHLVRRAEMRAQGHFMDHRYYDFDADIDIQPPT